MFYFDFDLYLKLIAKKQVVKKKADAVDINQRAPAHLLTL